MSILGNNLHPHLKLGTSLQARIEDLQTDSSPSTTASAALAEAEAQIAMILEAGKGVVMVAEAVETADRSIRMLPNHDQEDSNLETPIAIDETM